MPPPWFQRNLAAGEPLPYLQATRWVQKADVTFYQGVCIGEGCLQTPPPCPNNGSLEGPKSAPPRRTETPVQIVGHPFLNVFLDATKEQSPNSGPTPGLNSNNAPPLHLRLLYIVSRCDVGPPDGGAVPHRWRPSSTLRHGLGGSGGGGRWKNMQELCGDSLKAKKTLKDSRIERRGKKNRLKMNCRQCFIHWKITGQFVVLLSLRAWVSKTFRVRTRIREG